MTVSLQFNPEGAYYVAYAYVESNYALHIEQETFGSLRLQLKSVENGAYADCEDQLRSASVSTKVYDKDFNHGVLSEENPKWLRIISRTPVTQAFIIGDSVESR